VIQDPFYGLAFTIRITDSGIKVPYILKKPRGPIVVKRPAFANVSCGEHINELFSSRRDCLEAINVGLSVGRDRRRGDCNGG
jgi:hypothetical protein